MAVEPNPTAGRETEDRAVDFGEDIRPLLSNRCFVCHGPDEAERAAGLRLDSAEGAFEDLGGYAAITPGDAESSELMLRVTSDDPDTVMPPPESGKPFSADEIERLRRWIDQGAVYDRHWAYKRPSPPVVPDTADGGWSAGPIDRFVAAQHRRQGLTPTEDADRHALARRVAMDLTGLPPTWEQVTAFVADDHPAAYGRYVDSLLASPAFGERWARVWLDLARYADSAGYADDPPREIWAYRDYVLDSFNTAMPFDRFTIEQLAGDLLPDAGERQLIATAFHRNTMTNNEGGTNDEEFRNEAVVDRTNTTFAVWMGTTMACAQCHTHKFDPIQHEEYFQAFAFFNNTADADRRDESPTIEIYSERQKADRKRLTRQIRRTEEQLATPSTEVRQDHARWLSGFDEPPTWHDVVPDSAASPQRKLVIAQDGTVTSDDGKSDRDTYTIRFKVPPTRADRPIRFLRLRVPRQQKSNFVLTRLVSPTLSFERVVADHHQPGHPPRRAIEAERPNQGGWAIGGQTGQVHDMTLELATPVAAGDEVELELQQQSGFKRHLLDAFQLQVSADDDAMAWGRLPIPIRDALNTAVADRTDRQKTLLENHHRQVTPVLQPQRDRLERLKTLLAEIRPVTTVPVLAELPPTDRRGTHVQIRGNYQSKAAEVGPATPAAFHPLDPGPDGSPDRLDLARWLIDPANPLTARVIANRHWEKLFGIGIVSTSEEFGSQGERPTHPDLLDHLATELTRGDWDVKRLLREIVTSRTYRQASIVDEDSSEADPDNRFFARGPRHRITAEMVRDQALAVSGLLSHKMHGPPVRPPQPNLGLKAAFGGATDWTTSEGADRYRRGLYTTWRRSSPYPSMAAFDAPSREVCLVRRDRTNTPLQALVTLNDPVYVEVAQALARRVIGRARDDLDRVAWAFRHVLLREPSDQEAEHLAEFVATMADRYAEDPDAARQMAENPLGPLSGEAEPAEYAAWTVACNVLLNLDEVFMKR